MESLHPGIKVSKMLTLIDAFHLLQPVRDTIAFKCNCKDFMLCCICQHSTLFKMVWYPDETIPGEYSAVKIATRPSSRRPGVFDKSEPAFQDKSGAPKQVWNPTGWPASVPRRLAVDDDDFMTPPKKTRRKPVNADMPASKGSAPSGKRPSLR